MKNKMEDLDNSRHRKLTLKVRILQTAEDQKQFKVVQRKYFFDKNYFELLLTQQKFGQNIFVEFTHLHIPQLGDHRDPPQPWTL